MALLLLMFILGAVAGSLVTWALYADEAGQPEPTESGVWPL